MKSYRFDRITVLFVFGILISMLEIRAGNSISLHDTAHNRIDTLPAYFYKKQNLVSLAHLCMRLGIEWQWDRYCERFTLSHNDDRISFTQDNHFCQINDATVQLPYAPIRMHENLYLSARDAAAIFSKLKGVTLAWSQNTGALIFHGENNGEERDTGAAQISTTAPTEESGVPKEESAVVAEKMNTDVSEKKSRAKGSGTAVKEARQHIKTIVIDPGHGGKDPGAIGPSGVKEKDVVLPIGLALRDELEKIKGLSVYMTRSTDVFIPLRDRTKFANDKKADLFISIHANSVGGTKKRKNTVKGYKIYFLSQAKNEEDKLAAMIENSVIELEEDVQKGDFLQNVLIDMANNEFLTESQDLSIAIAESFGKALAKIRALQKGVGQANFWVLNGAYMPSVLVEGCFISNPQEEKLLTNKKFQKKIAVAIKDAVVEFKKKYEADL